MKKFIQTAAIAVGLCMLILLITGLIMAVQELVKPNINTISNNPILWTDPEKGVEYWLYIDGSKATMTERYNSDGTLSIAESY